MGKEGKDWQSQMRKGEQGTCAMVDLGVVVSSQMEVPTGKTRVSRNNRKQQKHRHLINC